jgi:hypothetical protein
MKHTHLFRLGTVLATALLVCLSTTAALATRYTFSGVGYWDNGNWSPHYPGQQVIPGDTVVIAYGADCTISVYGVSNLGTLINNGRISIYTKLDNFGFSNLTNNGTLYVYGGNLFNYGTLTNSGTLFGALTAAARSPLDRAAI